MSLVIGLHWHEHITIVGDTHLEDPLRAGRSEPLQGIVKTLIIADTVCVSFAGHLYWAEQVFQEIGTLGPKTVEQEDLVRLLLAFHERSSRATDFLVAVATPSPELIELKDGHARSVPSAWIGSAPAFERFQGLATGAITPIARPANTASLELLRLAEDRQGHTDENYQRLVSTMRLVIEDSGIPEVGGFVVPVGLHESRFEYLDYATVLTHPIRFDLMPNEFVIPFGTAEQGGYGFNLMSDRVSGTRGLAVYALQGHYGVGFVPREGMLRPSPFSDLAPLDFEEAVETQLGLIVRSMFTQPEEHCRRAIHLLESGDSDRALEQAQLGVERGSQVAEAYRCRGIVFEARGAFESAVGDFTRALELKPDHAPTLDNRGITLARMGRIDEAEADFSKAIAIAPAYARAYRHRALIARQRGDEDRARADEETVRTLIKNGPVDS